MWFKTLLFAVSVVHVYGVYRPHPGDRFQWQLSTGNGHVDYSMAADVYDFDLWELTRSDIAHIHAKHAKVICYFSAGSWDPNRPDADDFNDDDKGYRMDEWEEERWLDIRSSNVKHIMSKRMDMARDKGCDGIEPDNVDGFEPDNDKKFHFTASNQLDYNKWLAHEAHLRGLSIGLKNDVGQIHELHSHFDWALNEQCHNYDGGRECDLYKPFMAENKKTDIFYVMEG